MSSAFTDLLKEMVGEVMLKDGKVVYSMVMQSAGQVAFEIAVMIFASSAWVLKLVVACVVEQGHESESEVSPKAMVQGFFDCDFAKKKSFCTSSLSSFKKMSAFPHAWALRFVTFSL